MPLERLLIIFIAISSCTSIPTAPRKKSVDVETCIVNSDIEGAECVSRRFPDGWYMSMKDLNNYVCFSSWDMEKILEEWSYE